MAVQKLSKSVNILHSRYSLPVFTALLLCRRSYPWAKCRSVSQTRKWA